MTQPTDLETEAIGPSDAELIAAVRGGDSAAFGELFERHAGAAKNLARQHARNDSDADDLVSEAFAKVLQVLQGGGGPDVAFRAYLFTTLRRVAYDRTRAGSKVQLTDDISAYDPGVPFVDPALEGLERTLVAQAYGTLPERWRAVLWHTEVEGLSPAEVAPILGLTANGVSALAYRAREGLRQAYLQQHLAAPVSEGCAAVNDKLGAYARGGLSKRETAQVDEHLAGCVECRGLVAELADVNHGMRAVIAPLILGVLGAGLLKSGLLLGGAAAGTAAAAAARPETAATGTAAGVGAGAAATGAGTLVGAGAAGASGAAAAGAAATEAGVGAAAAGVGRTILAGGGAASARAAARWSLNPAAAAGIAAAVVGVVGLSAVAVAMLNGNGDGTNGNTAGTGDVPGLTAPVLPPGSESPSATTPVSPTPTDIPSFGPTSTAGGGPNPNGTNGGGAPTSSSSPTPTRSSAPSTSSSPSSGPTTSPTGSPSSNPTASPSSPEPSASATPSTEPTEPTQPPAVPVLTVSLEPLGDLVAGRSGVVGFTAGNTGEEAASSLTADVTLPPGVTLTGTNVRRDAGRSAGLPMLAPFAIDGDWACTTTPQGAHCTGPAVNPGSTVTAYLTVTAAPDSAGDTPVSVTVSAPGAESVTVTGTSGVAEDGAAVVVADRGHVGVTEVGASLLTCPVQDRGCTDALARKGSSLNNDNWNMTGRDDDKDPATKTSASSVLDLPADATISWAGLYWAGNVPAGASPDALGRIKLQGPGQAGYTDIVADRVDTGASTGAGPAYQSFADVTDQVIKAGAGTWWAADTVAQTGSARFGGWSLVVVYSSDTLPEGRVSVVDGFNSVSPGNDLSMTLPGTPGLQARVGLVAWEGDAGIDGDLLTLDGTALTPDTGAMDPDNVADAYAVGSAYANTFGVDAKPLRGAVFADSTAKVRVATRQDVFLIGVLTVSSER